MIIDLPDTTTAAVNRRLIEIRETGGVVALGRVMTLVIPTDEPEAEAAIRSANDASREHPCRVITVVRGNRRGASRLDAQVRVGGDAGASEVIVLRLYGPLADHGDSVVVPFLLPDAPIVCWWPGVAPDVPDQHPLGRMAQRRITDASKSKQPVKTLLQRAASHSPGDTDLAWTRVTLWRGQLAAALDVPPFESVTRAVVKGGSDSASSELLAAWLTLTPKCPVKRIRTGAGTGMISVQLERASGTVDLTRPDGNVATLTQPGQPVRRIALARRADRDCLAEELRRLDPDDIFAEVLSKGLPLLAKTGTTGAGGGKADEVSASAGERTPTAPAAIAPLSTAQDAKAAEKKAAEKKNTEKATEAATKSATAAPAKKSAKATPAKATPASSTATTQAPSKPAKGAKAASATRRATPRVSGRVGQAPA